MTHTLITLAAAAAAPPQAAPTIPLSWYLYVALALFAIGALGVLIRRNALTVLMSIEIMLNAVNLTFLAFARFHGDMGGHLVTFFVIAVAAAEAAVGLALVMSLFRHNKAVHVDAMTALRN
ncbi:MAG: NADH-quinone oxidoreductase subunit NuoK [Deltaproteobacteria bacterium]|nr:MAG: NADH-quinone oxidoreductase subunit NuoK [Deltaproteobacteria bacterium]